MDKPPTKSIRVSRVEKTLREVLGSQLSSMSLGVDGALVTLVRVSCSPDLRNAMVFVSVFGGDEDDVLDALEDRRAQMQHKVGKEIHMKFCPRLKFVIDGSIDKLVHVSNVLNDDQTLKEEE